MKPPISVPTESRRPNRLCSNCGVELFANYQEAGWNHCDREMKPFGNGCKFDGLFACAGKCQCPANTEMLGEFAASSSLLPVGRQLEHRIYTSAVIRRGEKFLCIHHTSLGVWLFPGGKPKEGEPFLDCLIRECREELGVTITSASFREAFINSVKGRQWVGLFYDVDEFEGEPHILEPQNHSALEWLSFDEMQQRATNQPEMGIASFCRVASLPVGESTREKESEELQQYRKDWPLLLREIALVSDDEEWSGPDASWTEDDILECFDPWDTLRKLQAKRAVGGSRWISVEEKLPEQSDMYLVAAKPSATNNVPAAFDVFSAVWEDDVLPGESPKWLEVNDRWVVTHWQPLPKPPGCI